MHRRQFLSALSAAPLFAANTNKIGRSRISFITDEAARTPADAIAFAKQYGLRWVELREVPGDRGHYASQSDEFLKQAAREFRDNGIAVSFLNTPYLKTTLPGTEPQFRKPETPEKRARRIAEHQAAFDRRVEDVRQGIRAAQLLGVDKMRLFAFLRVADPAAVRQRIADILGELAEIAGREGIRILLENEDSCNVATSEELGAMARLLPAKTTGINWDPMNGTGFGEKPFPDGYATLPKDRIYNVQIKGRTLLDERHKLDWSAICNALAADGYAGQVGLETHIFGKEQIAKSHESMREILRIVES